MSLVFGKEKVSRDAVREIATPKPVGNHFPIPHSVARVPMLEDPSQLEKPTGLVEMVEQGLIDAGFFITEEDHVLSREGQCYFGGFSVTKKDLTNKDRQIVCGVRNSHNKLFSTALCIGSRMMVCDNLDFSSEQVLSRKHTKFILRDLPDIISRIIGRLTDQWMDMEARIDSYKRVSLSEEQAARTLVRLAEGKCFPQTKIYNAFMHWVDPANAAKGIVQRYDYTFTDGITEDVEAYEAALELKRHELRTAFGCGSNVWGLYNAITEILKGSDANKLPDRTMKMQIILDELCNFDRDTQGEVAVDNGTGDGDQDQENFEEEFDENQNF